jgi:hypothetical protein
VILCDLEGRTRREVAQQLSLPEGTLSSRLATARKMLAKRLSRFELPLAGGVLALSFSEAVSAGVAESLVASTTKAALLIAAGQATAGLVSATVATLTEGVLRTMFIAKVKTATVVLFGVAALGPTPPSSRATTASTRVARFICRSPFVVEGPWQWSVRSEAGGTAGCGKRIGMRISGESGG